MFCIMVTGSPSATGSAAPPRFFVVGEQPGRAAGRKGRGDGLHAIFASHSSRLQPSLRRTSAGPQRPSRGHGLSLAGNG
eukprot:1156732-Prymnesium_polylepis.1